MSDTLDLLQRRLAVLNNQIASDEDLLNSFDTIAGRLESTRIQRDRTIAAINKELAEDAAYFPSVITLDEISIGVN